jgi:sulfonate transport system substrate-binding protein
VESANAHRSCKVQPVDADALAEQQSIADPFTGVGVIPKKVVIAASGFGGWCELRHRGQ